MLAAVGTAWDAGILAIAEARLTGMTYGPAARNDMRAERPYGRWHRRNLRPLWRRCLACAVANGVEDDFIEDSGGRLACGRGAGHRRGAEPLRIGDGRSGRSRRCTSPTTAFLLTPRRRPISAVLWPSSQSERRRRTATSVHSKSLLIDSSGSAAVHRAWAIAQSGGRPRVEAGQ
jgi:hypothetical protein